MAHHRARTAATRGLVCHARKASVHRRRQVRSDVRSVRKVSGPVLRVLHRLQPPAHPAMVASATAGLHRPYCRTGTPRPVARVGASKESVLQAGDGAQAPQKRIGAMLAQRRNYASTQTGTVSPTHVGRGDASRDGAPSASSPPQVLLAIPVSAAGRRCHGGEDEKRLGLHREAQHDRVFTEVEC